jgi:hypothetical protein
MPRRTCPSCLSAVSVQITRCPYCGAVVPADAATGAPPVGRRASQSSSVGPQAAASAGPGRAIDPTAILIGIGVIVLGTVIGSVVLGFLLAAQGTTEGTAPVSNAVGTDIASLILGLGLTVYGAYLAARRAGFRELVHAGIVGMLSMLLGLAVLLAASSAEPAWFVATSAILTMPCALLGGQLARRDG